MLLSAWELYSISPTLNLALSRSRPLPFFVSRFVLLIRLVHPFVQVLIREEVVYTTFILKKGSFKCHHIGRSTNYLHYHFEDFLS
ncbi:hypothetical protein P8452_53443 [Trifolium repens]|nr:hypothetical protein P8452_53443 [Trifolium repens]